MSNTQYTELVDARAELMRLYDTLTTMQQRVSVEVALERIDKAIIEDLPY